MSRPDPSLVEHHLRNLDRDACAEFVAALWAARGYDTSREGSVVVATHGDETLVIYPAVDSLVGRAPTPDRPVDVVVAPNGSRSTPTVCDREDCRVIDAADLRELLWYAVDWETSRDLCATYLGAPPGDLSLPVHRRLPKRIRTASLEPSVVAVGVVVVGLAAVLGVTLGTGFGGSPDRSPVSDPDAVGPLTPNPDESQSGSATSASAGPVETEVPTPSNRIPVGPDTPLPPGVNLDRVTNVSALGAAHNRTLRNRSYTLRVRFSRLTGGQNSTLVTRDSRVTVQDGQYLTRTTIDRLNGRTRSLEVFFDGEARYLADLTGQTPVYVRLSDNESGDGQSPNPFVLRRELADRYLATNTSAVVGRVARDGRSYYRIVGQGRESDLRYIDDYRVVAEVDRRGLIRTVRARYDVVGNTGSYEVRVTLTYDRIGETTVDAPVWYEQQFPTGNDTSGR